MLNRRFFLETAAIVLGAIVCAAVSNGLAARERKLKWVAPSVATSRVERPAAAVASSQTAVLTPVASATTPLETATMSTTAEITPPAPLTATVAPLITSTAAAAIVPPKAAAVPPVAQPAPVASAKQFPAHPDKPYIEISSEDAKTLFDRGAIFFDARRTSVFEEGHIRGAKNISVWEADLDEKVNRVFEQNLDPETPIVVYCAGGNCEDSHMLSQRLWGLGLNAVFVYKDGYPDWKGKGWPTAAGPQP